MSTSLILEDINASFDTLIKFGDNSAISGTLKVLSDGAGADLPIQVSTTALTFTGAAGTFILSNATASKIAAFDTNKALVSLDTTTYPSLAELAYVKGATEVFQDIINKTKIATITFIIDGGGSVITTGIKGDLEIPFACTINQVTLIADQSGSIVINIWKDTYANYPPLVGDAITASAKPTLSTANKSQDSTLTGWTTSITAGDILRFNVDSITTCTRVTLSLKVTKV